MQRQEAVSPVAPIKCKSLKSWLSIACEGKGKALLAEAYSGWEWENLGIYSPKGELPWENAGQRDEIEDFACHPTGCSFSAGGKSWELTIQEFPEDKFGNRATVNRGLDLTEDCDEVGWFDDLYTGYETEFNFPNEWELDGQEVQFLQFVMEKYPDIVQELSVGITYWTTDRPLDGPEWQAAYDAWVESA